MDITLYPKQQEAVSQTCFEIGFGGSRGPGKTFAGICWLLYDVHNPKLRALVIRRNAEDLKDWVDRATQIYCVYNKATKVGSPAEFHFPSGAVIRTGHLKDGNAYMKYQGHEYQRMLIEELTQIVREEDYLRLMASCRSTVEGLPAQVFSTFNPGGPGHEWVKQRFILPAEPGKIFQDGLSGRTRVFISANVYDNPHIMEHDPDYVHYLESLPSSLKKQWLEGSWEDFDVEGAIFGQEMQEVRAQGRISRIQHDPLLLVHTYWDLGRNDFNAIGFVQKVGREVRAIDYIQDQFKGMRQYLYMMKERESMGYKYGCFYFPHDIMVHEYTTNRTRLDTFKSYFEEIWGREPRLIDDYQVVDRMKSMQEGHDAARILLPYCYFDSVRCAEWIYALKTYHRKLIEGTNSYSNEPVHDEASHGASAFMQLALSNENMMEVAKKDREKTFKRELGEFLPKRKEQTVNYLTGEVG